MPKILDIARTTSYGDAFDACYPGYDSTRLNPYFSAQELSAAEVSVSFRSIPSILFTAIAVARP